MRKCFFFKKFAQKKHHKTPFFAPFLTKKCTSQRITEPEEYFAAEKTTCYDNEATGVNGDNEWRLNLKSFAFGNDDVITFREGTKVVFDATTKYIWTPSDDNDKTTEGNDIMEEIKEKLNINHGAQCAKDPEDDLIHCICN